MEVKMEDLDRIVITSNDQMQKIIEWFQLNINNIIEITNDKVMLPIYDGVVLLVEEGILFEFHDLGAWVHFVVYMHREEAKEYVKIFEYEADLTNKTPDLNPDAVIRNKRFFTNNVWAREKMDWLLTYDNMIGKIIFKFFAIMCFMLFNEEIVEVDHSQDKPRTRRVARAMKIRDQPLSLVRKTYVVKNFDPKKTKIKGAPRRWTAPDHEVAVRGHYRHLQSGKVIWIRECTKFKDKGNKRAKEWRV